MCLNRTLPHLVVALGLALGSTDAAAQNDSVLYVPSNQLSEYWQVSKPVKPKYPRGPDNSIEEACVVVAYIIESTGRTSTERAIAAYPSERFAESAIKAIRKFKFEPGEANPHRTPVYTSTMITFQLSRSDETDEKVKDALVDICASAAQTILNEEAGAGK